LSAVVEKARRGAGGDLIEPPGRIVGESRPHALLARCREKAIRNIAAAVLRIENLFDRF
jgi:hypothetical protein